MICDSLPRTRLADLPTPLEEAPRLSDALGGPRIFIKRDDRSGLCFGGNKPRIFEYVFGDALRQGCDVMITPAGVQSNHLREVTAAANKLGVKSVIIICGGTGQEEPQGNLLLFHLLGAEIRYFGKDLHAYDDPELWAYIDSVKAEYEARGHKPYIVHFSLRSGLLGSAAHVTAAEELAAQFAEAGIDPDYLYVPSGSGVTTSGFVLGFKHLGLRTRVMGICVLWPAEQVARDVERHANEVAEELGLATRVGPEDFTVTDKYISPGYGVMTPQVNEAIRLWATREGILLDPSYNGKTMAGIIDQIRSGALTREHTVVLVHTGGVPALFAQNRALIGE